MESAVIVVGRGSGRPRYSCSQQNIRKYHNISCKAQSTHFITVELIYPILLHVDIRCSARHALRRRCSWRQIWHVCINNKAIRDGRPRPPRHQCVYQISSWSVEKWLRYYTLKFCENTDKHTDTQTHRQTWALQYLAIPLWGAR